MVTLQPLGEPYASVWVAIYEPLLLRWLSGRGLADLSARLCERRVPAAGGTQPTGAPTMATLDRFRWKIEPVRLPSQPAAPREEVGLAGRVARAVRMEARALVSPTPVIARRARVLEIDDEEAQRRRRAIGAVLADATLTAEQVVERLDQEGIPNLLGLHFEHVLSPIGVAHIFRQLYFDLGAGVGPLEHAFSVAPREELEIVQELERRESIERIEEFGSESTLESQSEQVSLEEIADHVQSSVARDMTVGVSASAHGTIGVWSAGARASAELGVSTENAREQARTRSLTQTRKSAEIIRKSYSLTVKSFSEFSERSSMKRVVRNESDVPVSYGLRRVLRTVRVKLQSLGPRLVWQVYVGRPGERLARSRLVMFREADPAAVPGMPPNAPPRPQGGSIAGSQTVDIEPGATPGRGTIKVAVALERDKTFTAMTIDSISDAQPSGKDPKAPGIIADEYSVDLSQEGRAVYTFSVATGSAHRAAVGYTLYFEPSPEVVAVWEEQVAAARQGFQASQLEEAFERAKRIIVAKSRVRPRPASDLRGEERYEILNRMISEAIGDSEAGGLPSPAEVELFHRYFEVGAIFYYVHPSWWRPRAHGGAGEYEITEDSEPAPFGKSLGWLIQLDGDRRRNEFLNSPWVRVCVPIRPGAEEAACRWLAERIEGTRGFSLEPSSRIGKLIADVVARREEEQAAAPGPDYVSLDGEVAPSREAAAAAYPVVDEFDVVVPTDGFVYESLRLADS